MRGVRNIFFTAFIVGLSFFLSVSPAFALPGARSYTNTSTGDVFLGGNYIELGLSKYGSFGTSTGQSKPDGFFGTAARNHIGMSSNAAGFGNSPDTRIDYFLPGTPEERWVVGYKIGGTPTIGGNAWLRNVTNISDNTVTNQSSGNTLKATSVGTFNSRLKVTQVVQFSVNDSYFRNVITLENVGATSLDSVRYMRSFDPDNTVDQGGMSATKNQILYTHAAGDGKAVVMADTSNNNSDPVYLENNSRSPILFFTDDTRARVSTFGFANSDPYAADAYDSADAKGTTETGDQGITVTFDVGTMAPGETKTFVYFNSLDNRDFDEVLEEIAEAASINNAPDTPSPLGPTSLVNGSGTSSNQPALTFSLNDSDATNSAKFRIQIDNNSNFASPEVDYTSALASQGGRTFTVGQAAGSGSYTTGSASQTLTDGTYYWRVKAFDNFNYESAYAAANSGSAAFIVNTSTPGISNVNATPDDTTATVTWTTTEQTSSRIEYGLVPAYGFQTSETDTSPRVTSHSIELTNLKECTRYFYRVKSKNNANTEAVSSQGTFITTNCDTSSIVDGEETNIDKSTGGNLSLNNNSSVVTLAVPANFAALSASFQINKLNTSSPPTPPSGKNLVDENLFDLVAVTTDDNQLTTFDEDLTFTIQYGADTEAAFDESTLDVYYYDAGNWMGLGCTVDINANTLTCTLSHFSTYGVFGNQKSSGSSTNSTSSAPPSPPGCGAEWPSSIPDLFQIDRKPTSATVYFTPILNTNQYYISYSTNPFAEEHGVMVQLSSDGVQQFTVEELLPSMSYYFKVRGQKDCMSGHWSNIRLSTLETPKTSPVSTEETESQRQNQEEETQQKEASSSPSTMPSTSPSPSPQTLGVETTQDVVPEGFLAKIKNFFKNLFN